MVRSLLLVMLLEFIIVHSSAFMGQVMVGGLSRQSKARSLLGLCAMYTLFVGGFALAFRTWQPLLSFWLLTLNRLLSVVLGQAPDGEEKELLQRGWAVSTLAYLGFTFLTIVLPVPRLGITRAVALAQQLPSSGLWVDQPHRAVALGFLYFTAVGISELGGHRWLKVRASGSASVPQAREA